MPMIGQQHVNSVKTTLYYGPKNSIECPFFPISHEKITTLMPIFCKNVHSLKTHSSHYVNSLKNTVLSRHFFQKFLYKPNTLMPIFGQKTSILLKLHYFMVIKVTRMPFLFRFFTKKSLLS